MRQAKSKSKNPVQVIRSIPEYLSEDYPMQSGTYTETLYKDSHLPQHLQSLKKDCCTRITWAGSEVRTLVTSGPTENRIDLTFVGDGYTEDEKEKYFSDIERFVKELFSEKTFSSYLPLFNVHAVFVPSKESGLTDSTKKDTALGLYRTPVGSKRAIMPGNTRAIDRALSLAPDTDYPILIANDDYYGGLGGRYAITTRSVESGKIVLRHELGHNFGEVGEEYDGGYVYSGANSSHSLPLSWSHWVEGTTKTFEGKQLTGDYVWQNLSGRPFKRTFNFPEGNYIFDSIVSTVGWGAPGEVSVLLNGQEQDLIGRYTQDRSFFTFHNSLPAGKHTVEAKENIFDQNNVLAFLNIYALPADIIKDKGFIGAYATFDINGQKSYRPTFDTCIMREMSSDEFCSVDKENFWQKFLSRMTLIDGVEQQKTTQAWELNIKTPQLAGLQFHWSKLVNNRFVPIAELTGPQVSIPLSEPGEYRLRVKFVTPEVRRYTSDFDDVRDFNL